MASDFLKRKVEEQGKKNEKKYGKETNDSTGDFKGKTGNTTDKSPTTKSGGAGKAGGFLEYKLSQLDTDMSGQSYIPTTTKKTPTTTIPTTSATPTSTVQTTKTQGGNKDSWLKGGAFADGYDVGDGVKTVLGTIGDIGIGALKGVGRMAEGLVDLGTYGVAGVADLLGADEFAKKAKDVAIYSATDEWTKGMTDYVDKYSVLGNKADSISEGLGQVAAIIATGGLAGAAGLGGAGATAVTTGAMGLSSMGTNMGEAYKSGATDGEAVTYGLTTGAIEAGTELLFGGLGKGVKALGISRGIGGLDDIFAKKLASKATSAFTNEGVQRLVGNAIEFGVKSAGEGFEEVLAGYGSALMKNLTYMDDKKLSEIVADENLLEQFVVGTLVSSIVQSPSYVNANRTGTDFVTGQTYSQEKVIDAIAENEIAKREANGEELTDRDKNNIYNDVVETINKVFENENQTAEQPVNEIETEQPISSETTEPDTLEKAAIDVVNAKNANQTGENEAVSGVEETEDSLPIQEENEVEKPVNEEMSPVQIAEAKSLNGELISEEEASAASGYGTNGAKLLADTVNNATDKSFSEIKGDIHLAYMNGWANTNYDLKTDLEREAYFAGMKDRTMQDLSAKENAKGATIYDGVFNENEYANRIDSATREMVTTIAKDLRMSVDMVEKIVANIVNGVEYEANASHTDGKMKISSTAEKAIYQLILHESGHRMEQFATDEWNALLNALYERAESLSARTYLGVTQGMRFDDMKAQHDAAGIAKDTSGYVGEVVMRELETIFSSPQEFNKWIAELDADPQLKTAWQKFMDFITELIEGIKHIIAESRMSEEAKEEARKELEEMEHIKKLYAEAYKATREAVAEREIESWKSALGVSENTVTERTQEAQNTNNRSLESKTSKHQEDVKPNYSLRQEFASEIDLWDGVTNTIFHTGTTSEALKSIGVQDRQIIWHGKKIAEILRKHKNMSREVIKQVPQIMEHPVIVMKSQKINSRITMFGEVKDAEGHPVLAVLELKPTNKGGELLDMNVVASAYGKDSNPAEFIKNSELLYLDTNKNRTNTWLNAVGLQLPSVALTHLGSIGNITYVEGNVNIKGIPYAQFVKNESNFSLKDSDGNTLTKEQQEYFKDSKVRNENGNLLVMYQGSAEDFTVFDRKKSSYANLYGRGFYFTKSETHASQYGNTRAYYLNIKHPVSTKETTITKSQLRKFLQAVSENEDYSFENYGYDATVDSVLQSIYGKSDFLMLNDVSQTAIGDLVEAVELFNEINGTDYNGIILDTETVIFNSEQAKLISNKKPTNNPDTRFDLKDVCITQTDVDAVRTIATVRGEISVNEFTSDDIKTTENWAKKFYSDINVRNKSPFFRAWFGDWRAKEKTPVSVVYADKKTGKNPRGVFKNRDTGWSINSSSVGYDETVSHSGKDKLSLIAMRSIDEIIKNSILLDTEVSKYGRGKKSIYTAFMHKFYSYVVIENKPYIAKMAVDESYSPGQNDTNKKFYHVRAIKIEPVTSVGIGFNHIPIMDATDSNITVSDLFNLVKQNDKNFKPKESSKIVNADGTPKVMYHGSKNKFSVFNKGDKTRWLGKGIYFAENKQYARKNGKNVFEVYLNVKNPFVVNGNSPSDLLTQVKEIYPEANLVNVSDILSKNGYDAIILNHWDYGEIISVFEENQIKSATDNIGTFDNSNNDINFSLKDVNDLSTKDQKELLDIIAHLKGEFEVTKFAKADPKQLAKMTREILKDYSSRADYDTVFKAIDELYTYMANGENGESPVWTDVYNRAYNIAQEIVENAVEVDDYTYNEYKGLREYLRTTPMRFDSLYDSVPADYENFSEFRKRNFGRLLFTKDGASIDSVYQELSGMYPEFFDEYEATSSADQLEQMLDVLGSIQKMEVNPFDRHFKQASMHLANDLTSRFFDIPQAKPTFADKAERRVIEQGIKVGKKVQAVREQRDAKIKKLMESQKEKTKKQLDKIREQRNKKVKAEQEKRRKAISKMSEAQKAKVLRARITRHAGELSKKLLSPTDKQHIPQDLQGAVAKLLECINLESNYTYDVESGSYKKNDDGLPTRRTQAFNALKDLYEKMEGNVTIDPDLMGADGLLSEVIQLSDKRIVDMTSQELETVWQTLRAVEASISTANKMFAEGKFAEISEMAEALRTENADKKEKTELKGLFGKGKKLATLDMLTPETYLHCLGDAGDAIFRMMRDAQDKHISIMKEVSDFTHKTLKGVNVNSLEKTMHTVKLGGEDVKLSTAQLMELYVLMNREQATEHIYVGGILPDKTQGKGMKLNTRANPIRNLTPTEISTALSELTAEEKKIADELQKFVSTVLSGYGNEASMKVYNYEKFLEKNYWTIRTNKQEINSEVGKDTAVTSVANKGMAKGTKPHANTSVRIGSIFDTFASHSSDMATYAAWLGATEDINRIRNFVFWKDGVRTGTVKGILDTVHGIHGAEYLQKLMTDISIGVKGTDNMNPFDKLIGSYKAASVGANLRVIIQQPTAILRAMDMIDTHYLVSGLFSPLKGWKKAKQYAPIAQWKDWGYFDINTGRQMKDVLFENASKLEKVKQWSMLGASLADSFAWGQLWNAVEAETRAKRNDLTVGSEEYYNAVAKRFTEIVDHTQVVDGILQRSQIMRSADNLTKMATSFMGEPTKQYNMAIAAAYDAKNSKGDAKKKAVNRLGRTAISLAVAGIINAAAQSIIDAMRDDDKEEDYWEKWLASFVGDGEDTTFLNSNLGDTVNPLNYVPFAKDIVSIIQGYDVKRMDAESITKTINAITNMYKAVKGESKYTVAEASAQLFAEIARLYGVPVANVKRDIKALFMSTAIETNNYVMQYRMEKGTLDINYSGNSKNFMDILYNAYANDREAYEIIYDDLLKSGYDADKIQSAMETRMKKAAGVDKSSDLAKRYMAPETEKQYDSSLNRIKSTSVWQSANETQRKDAEADLYEYLTSTSDSMVEMRTEATAFGVDETEYALWQLARDMAESNGNTSLNAKEKASALEMLDLGNSEITYFYATEQADEAFAYGIDMMNYAMFKASVNGLKGDDKKDKVISYANMFSDTEKEYLYFMGTVYPAWKNRSDYIRYFGN